MLSTATASVTRRQRPWAERGCSYCCWPARMFVTAPLCPRVLVADPADAVCDAASRNSGKAAHSVWWPERTCRTLCMVVLMVHRHSAQRRRVRRTQRISLAGAGDPQRCGAAGGRSRGRATHRVPGDVRGCCSRGRTTPASGALTTKLARKPWTVLRACRGNVCADALLRCSAWAGDRSGLSPDAQSLSVRAQC